VRDRHYVLATAPRWIETSPFAPVAERLRGDPAWQVHDLPTTHNVLAGGPETFLALLLTLL
jgi:hypothetical protein